MNEPLFIELLNLYVDQQLSATEAAELESEIKQNPARRRTYQQYCRMQKACAQLFEHERSAAPASAVLARDIRQVNRKVVNFPAESARPLWSTSFSIAAVAAAACVALVVLRQAESGSAQPEATVVATTAENPNVSTLETDVAASHLVATVKAESDKSEFQPIFTAQTLRAHERQNLFFVSSVKTEESRLEWMRQVQLEPIRKVSAENFAFGSRAPADKPINATFSSSSNDEQAMEMNAFQFQR
jgi:anti-sigma-K factor RskA